MNTAQPQGPFCQSCAMPMHQPEHFGKEADGFPQAPLAAERDAGQLDLTVVGETGRNALYVPPLDSIVQRPGMFADFLGS